MRPTTREDKITEQLATEIKQYQAAGGEVKQVPRGLSAYQSDGKIDRSLFTINGNDKKKRFKR
jgi:hypothetical protein